jgi:hypothetical protein
MAAAFCFHANTKTVGAFTTSYWWLICAFHNYFLASLRFSLFSLPPSIVFTVYFFIKALTLLFLIYILCYPQLIHWLILCG